MTTPNPISQYAPNNENGDRQPFTDKKDLLEVPLIITTARTARGKQGVFWIVEAARQDTGEAVVFTGSTVIDQTMAAVKEAGGFPVAAMLVKIQPEEGNWYWNLVDPPGAESAPSNGQSVGGSAPASDRVQFIKSLIDAHEAITTEVVRIEVHQIAGAGKKVNDLTDEQWSELQSRIDVLAGSPF